MKTAAVIHELIGGSSFVYVADRQQDGQIQKVNLWVNQHGNIEYEIESYINLRKDVRPCDTQYGIGIPIRSVEKFQELEWTVYEQTYDLPGILQKIQDARDDLILNLAGDDNPWCRARLTRSCRPCSTASETRPPRSCSKAKRSIIRRKAAMKNLMNRIKRAIKESSRLFLITAPTSTKPF